VSLRIELSASPAEARASTNPASTSVSNAATSSAPDGARSSRMSRTSARPNRKVALVTGSARGLGRAIAERYASLGANVVINYSSSQAAAIEAVKEIEGLGGQAIAVRANVSRVADLEELFAAALDHFGRLDIVVANAGVELIETATHRPTGWMPAPGTGFSRVGDGASEVPSQGDPQLKLQSLRATCSDDSTGSSASRTVIDSGLSGSRLPGAFISVWS
jgi:NAD(P)-dependent dehydrogenase (short-subunit alcohol dehydrogenase family)